MALTGGEKWALGGGAVAVLVGAGLAMSSTANAATAPASTPLVGPADGATPPPPPTVPEPPARDGYVPPTRLLQSRPLERADTMSAAARRDAIAIAQGQLNTLDYGPLARDGINGPLTQAAAHRFNVDHAPAVAAYLSSVGNDRGVVYAIDDAYRQRTAASNAPDYVAPSASLWSPARRRWNARR